MSLFDTYDSCSEEIIQVSQQHSFQTVDAFPEVMIAAFKDETFRLLEANYPVEQVAVLREGRTIPVYQIIWHGKTIGIYQTLVGGSASVCLLEQALARGVKKFLFYGNCGVLKKDIAAGHLIVPTAAYRDEGTSYHYLPVSDYVESDTCNRLTEIFDEMHLPYVLGKIWTTDAFYRETRNNMEKRKADGCIAVDMECASIMAAAQFRGVEVYQFLYADDCLDGETWDPRTLGVRPVSGHEKYLRLALEIATKL